MAENSKIEWTDASWNPIRARRLDNGKVGWHCELHSPGCENCYAQTMNGRNLPGGGTGLDYTRTSRDLVETFIDVPTLGKPLRWRKPKMVFVCSMTDLFAKWVTDQQICQVFAVMACAHWHTFQVLTKRADRMRSWLNEYAAGGRHVWPAGQLLEMPRGMDKPLTGWPLPNVWLGVSAEDQVNADKRIPNLLRCPAAVRFVSYEPAIGPIDFHSIWPGGMASGSGPYVTGIDWIIVGGESGAGARPCRATWVRDTVRQCADAGVACFVKQLGANAEEGHGVNRKLLLKNSKGGDPSEWPEDLRVREFPKVAAAV